MQSEAKVKKEERSASSASAPRLSDIPLGMDDDEVRGSVAYLGLANGW